MLLGVMHPFEEGVAIHPANRGRVRAVHPTQHPLASDSNRRLCLVCFVRAAKT